MKGEGLVHRLAVSKIQATFLALHGVNLHRRGFKKAIKGAMGALYWSDPANVDDTGCPGEAEEWFHENFSQAAGWFSRLPDLYAVQESRRSRGGRLSILAVEVEDSSRIDQAKLEEYAQLWWNLDCEGHEVKLWVCDRYGNNWHRVDLVTAHYTAQGWAA